METIESKESAGFTLVEVILGAAILGLLSLFLAGAACPLIIGIEQAENETLASNMAFAVLEAIRAEAEDLDLDSPLTLYDLGLSNPNNLIVTIYSEQDMETPELYQVSVQVDTRGRRHGSVSMCTVIRRCGE